MGKLSCQSTNLSDIILHVLALAFLWYGNISTTLFVCLQKIFLERSFQKNCTTRWKTNGEQRFCSFKFFFSPSASLEEFDCCFNCFHRRFMKPVIVPLLSWFFLLFKCNTNYVVSCLLNYLFFAILHTAAGSFCWLCVFMI